ncbi:MAG: AAA family ATPase [Planctomycetes bacterium]|nr:AAA family ATPase [Planctomycetota bacterium]
MPAPPIKQFGTPNRPMPKGRAIDPVRVLRRYWKGIPIWGIIGAIVGTGSFFVLAKVYPLYTAEVMLEVRPGLVDATEISTTEAINDKMVERVAATQTFIIKGRLILTEAVEDRTMNETTWIQHFIDAESGLLLVDKAVDELEEDVRTIIRRGTNLYGIAWSSHTPTDVPIVVNAIARAYMRRTKELDDEGFRQNADLFETAAANLRFALADQVEDIRAFIQQNGITTLDDSRFSAEAFQLQQITKTQTDARQGLVVNQQEYSKIAAKLDGTMEPTMEDRLIAEKDPIILRQEQTLEALQANLRALRERLGASHPQIKEAEIAVRATKDQIEVKLETIIRRNLNARLRDSITLRDQLIATLARLDGEIESKDAIMRELAANQSTLEGMQSLRADTENRLNENQRLISSLKLMQMRADAGRVRKLAPALEPREKSFPTLEIFLPAGIFFGVALYVGVIFLKEITDQKIRSGSDVLIIPGAKIAGILPDIDEDPSGLESPELVLLHDSECVFAESCRQVWAGINRSMQQSAHQTLLVLSAAPEAGTTTVIGNYAVAAQASGVRTVVVDCNFRRPSLASMFDYDDASDGIADLLANSAGLEEVIHSSNSGVDVISAGTPANRLFQRLGSEKMKSILAQLRDKYDLVIIDAPPSIVAGDAVLLANMVDAITLVVQSDRDERGLVARVLRELGESRGEVLGVTLNAAVGTVGGYFRKNYLAMVTYSEQEDDDE